MRKRLPSHVLGLFAGVLEEERGIFVDPSLQDQPEQRCLL